MAPPPPEERPTGIGAATDLERRTAERFPGLAFALRGLDARAAWLLTTAALFLLLFRKFGGSGYFEVHLRPQWLRDHHYLSVYGDFWWFGASFFLLGVLPLLASAPRRLRPARLGLGIGDWRFGLKWTGIGLAVMVPVVFAAARFSTFWRYYPLNDRLGGEAARLLIGLGTVPDSFWIHFVLYEVGYGLYFVGWEYVFRGYMTFGLYDRMGVLGVFVANIPFVLLHTGKPFPEALGSLVAGVALGLFALRARSFWYCWALHAATAWTMDLAAILRRAELATG